MLGGVLGTGVRYGVTHIPELKRLKLLNISARLAAAECRNMPTPSGTVG